ncbi:IclR family transcriptional regulator [Aquamicrobium sp. LC103]|uniref:IclR family transcriptional regulator n=1 Tax=Aquamicrobium sp. LC103 TaxID=1120658 RepID=UPI00063E8D61|nr:IclR family transcriptional regulator [Aquamicrobium sp. LC103]TKT76189.1 IclR family transcriptional regulator [Aquamicrobium sp. LC103]
MTSVLERSLGILELLSEEPDGLSVSAIATRLDVPPSAAHRLLNELARFGYVRQDRAQGDYSLTIKLAAMGINFLGQSGVTDVAQPILDRLAQTTGELIRQSVLDGRQLVWVGVAQGATSGLRYDPGREQGVLIHFASSAGGQAYLSTLSDEDALMLVAEQGFTSKVEPLGPKAPKTAAELLKRLEETRKRGYSIAIDSYIVGMAAMAVPVRYGSRETVIGTLSVAGPAARLTPERMADFAAPLTKAAEELGQASKASRFFQRARSNALAGSEV